MKRRSDAAKKPGSPFCKNSRWTGRDLLRRYPGIPLPQGKPFSFVIRSSTRTGNPSSARKAEVIISTPMLITDYSAKLIFLDFAPRVPSESKKYPAHQVSDAPVLFYSVCPSVASSPVNPSGKRVPVPPVSSIYSSVSSYCEVSISLSAFSLIDPSP